MKNLNFTIPPATPSYDTRIALKYFKAAGSAIAVKAGKTIFVENERSNPLFLQQDKMYFLLEGEVELTVNKTQVSVIHEGEIFGEMALITKMPRTATATAKTDCRLFTMTNSQLQAALITAPDFELLLMSIMITRLRDTIAFLKANGTLTSDDELKDAEIFDKKMLDKLSSSLDGSAYIRCAEDKVIVQEGSTGVLMYVVLKGTVEIAVQNNVIGTIERGGIFGEMALITQAGRVATAVAKTDCELLAINRNQFLSLIGVNPKFAVSLLGAVGNRARFMASMRNH